jgi:hypothetical protein
MVAEGASVNSDLIALVVGAGVGLAIVVRYAWPHRAEVIQGWKDLLGLASEARPRPMRPAPHPAESPPWTSRKRRLTIALCLLAILGSAAIAVQTGNGTVRLANILVGGILVVATAILLFDPRQPRSRNRGHQRSGWR